MLWERGEGGRRDEMEREQELIFDKYFSYHKQEAQIKYTHTHAHTHTHTYAYTHININIAQAK